LRRKERSGRTAHDCFDRDGNITTPLVIYSEGENTFSFAHNAHDFWISLGSSGLEELVWSYLILQGGVVICPSQIDEREFFLAGCLQTKLGIGKRNDRSSDAFHEVNATGNARVGSNVVVYLQIERVKSSPPTKPPGLALGINAGEIDGDGPERAISVYGSETPCSIRYLIDDVDGLATENLPLSPGELCFAPISAICCRPNQFTNSARKVSPGSYRDAVA